MGRKSVNFNVSSETYERVRVLFPDAIGTDENLNLLITGYCYWLEHRDDATKDNSAEMEELETRNMELKGKLDQSLQEAASLKEEINRLHSIMEDGSAASTEEAAVLRQQISDLTAERDSLNCSMESQTQEINKLQHVIESMQAEHDAPSDLPNTISGTVDDFTLELLNLVTERLAILTGVDGLTPFLVLIDGFLKYNVQQYNCWFYDFVVSKREILEIAHKHQPEIDSMKKLQKAIGIYD